MEAHQIPKNVTEFEFHLVGDMTIKQFIYLALGLGGAYLTFVIFVGTYPLIAYPLIAIFASIGVALAFLPIMERPLDHWVGAYFQSIFSPTQRGFDGSHINVNHPAFSKRLDLYINTFYPAIKGTSKIPPLPVVNVAPVATPPQPQPVQQQQVVIPPPQPQAAPPITPNIQKEPEPLFKKEPPLPSSDQLHKSVELAQQSQIILNKIRETERVLSEIRAQAAVPGTNPSQFTERFQNALNTLQKLSSQETEISKNLAVLAQTQIPVAHPKKIVIKPQPPAAHKDVQLILTTVPNLINGIVTDTQGSYLEGVIVVTHDKQGLPVRALKTNKLGQFLAATPLPNSTYNITLEKEGLIFDNLEITLDGSVIAPIKVAAKKGGI